MAAQLTSTNGPVARGPARWSSRATSPFPVPVSPWIRTGGSRRVPEWRRKSRPTVSRMVVIPGLSPITSLRTVMGRFYLTPAKTRRTAGVEGRRVVESHRHLDEVRRQPRWGSEPGGSAAEELLERVEKAADHGTRLAAVRGLVELLEQLALAGGQLGGHLDYHLVAGVSAATPPVELGHPLPGQPQDLAVLGAGRHLEPGRAVEHGHLHLGAQRGLGERDRHRAQEILAVAGEEGVVADVDHDVEIARRPAAQSPLALAGHPQLHVGVDAGRDAHLQGPLAGGPALTLAGLAGVPGDLAFPLALRAGAGDGEEALLEAELTAPLAGRTLHALGAGFHAGALADLARLRPRDLQPGLHAF